MVSYNLKIEVEIKKVIPDTNDTGNKDTRNKIMQGESRHEECNGTGNGKCAANSNQDEVHVAVMNSAARTLEYVLS